MSKNFLRKDAARETGIHCKIGPVDLQIGGIQTNIHFDTPEQSDTPLPNALAYDINESFWFAGIASLGASLAVCLILTPLNLPESPFWFFFFSYSLSVAALLFSVAARSAWRTELRNSFRSRVPRRYDYLALAFLLAGIFGILLSAATTILFFLR